jgi:hypothetical protein
MLLLVLTSCKNLDVVGEYSIKSFEELIRISPVTDDIENNSWVLTAPDGKSKFIWSKDFNKTPIDAKIIVDAAPFINAGLNIDALPKGMYYDNNIIVGIDLGEESLVYEDAITPLKSYEQIVKLKRESINYHTALDHYGVNLGEGNVFEWAKDMSTNDKDIVFVLNPEILINAGVKPDKVEGWIFAKVEVMDKYGQKIEVDKFLKPFNLK